MISRGSHSLRLRLTQVLLLACATFGFYPTCSFATTPLIETAVLEADVAGGRIPPVAKRIPSEPLVTSFDGTGFTAGTQGGTLHMLIARAQDVRAVVAALKAAGRGDKL